LSIGGSGGFVWAFLCDFASDLLARSSFPIATAPTTLIMLTACLGCHRFSRFRLNKLFSYLCGIGTFARMFGRLLARTFSEHVRDRAPVHIGA
jgi:hypothetical protein